MTNHVLVLEDDPQLSHLYTRILSRAGYCVDIAQSLEGAQRLISENDYAIFVCDLHVEAGSSSRLLRCAWDRLKQHGTKVFLVSGQEQYRLDAAELDIEYFFSKPVTMPDIIQYVNRLARC